MPAPLLQSNRVILRALQRSDIHWLVELGTDPDVRGTTLQPLRSAWQATIEAVCTVYGDHSKWAIEDRKTRVPVGWISISHKPLAPAPYPSIGFEMRRQFWNSGYATESLSRLTEHLFQDLGLKFVSGLVFVNNEASQRVFVKAGFENLGPCVCSGHPCFLFQMSTSAGS